MGGVLPDKDKAAAIRKAADTLHKKYNSSVVKVHTVRLMEELDRDFARCEVEKGSQSGLLKAFLQDAEGQSYGKLILPPH
jgi:hypothetical protein